MNERIADLRLKCQPYVRDRFGNQILVGHWHNVNFTRKFSIYISAFLVDLNVTANTVTATMIIVGLVGAAMLVPHVMVLNLIGFMLLIAFEVFDCVDGEMARMTGKSSIKGYYLDLISHVFCNHLHKTLLPLHLYLLSAEPALLLTAFFIYACSISEHAVRKCFIQATAGLKAAKVDVGTTARSTSGALKRITLLLKALQFPTKDIFLLRTLTFALIIMSYFIDIYWLSLYCYVLALQSALSMAMTVIKDIFFNLPDSEHVKQI